MPLNARDGGLSRDVANVTSVVCSRFSPVPGIKGFFSGRHQRLVGEDSNRIRNCQDSERRDRGGVSCDSVSGSIWFSGEFRMLSRTCTSKHHDICHTHDHLSGMGDFHAVSSWGDGVGHAQWLELCIAGVRVVGGAIRL